MERGTWVFKKIIYVSFEGYLPGVLLNGPLCNDIYYLVSKAWFH
jgi:hypothetical protein